MCGTEASNKGWQQTECKIEGRCDPDVSGSAEHRRSRLGRNPLAIAGAVAVPFAGMPG
jgi:hypothetical protein